MYKRILIKISGEALQGTANFGICPEVISRVANEIKSVVRAGVEVGIVVGGGNIFRGVNRVVQNSDRIAADYMGMLATIFNALALQEVLESIMVPSRVQSAIIMSQLCEPYVRRKAIRHLEKKRVVIFAAGLGSPCFTTDSAACLRAIEIQADAVFKATKVDGVYSANPDNNPDALLFSEISYRQVLTSGLKIMDSTAISLCMDNKMPIHVFNMKVSGNIEKILKGIKIGSLIGE